MLAAAAAEPACKLNCFICLIGTGAKFNLKFRAAGR